MFVNRNNNKLLAFIVCCTAVTCLVAAQFDDDFSEEDMMRQREGMMPPPPDDGPREKVTIGVLKRPSTCEKRVQPGSKVAVNMALSKLVPSAVAPGEMEKVAVFSKKKLIVASSGRFIEGVEEGVLGACVGEKRSLRIPASLGFAEEGSRKLNILPDTDLRAIVEIEDFEEPDPYGEGMDDMSPDEDMDEQDGREEREGGGMGDDDSDEDDNEAITGPYIPEGDFSTYVPKVTTSQMRELVKAGKTNVFVMFYAPWCGHCTAIKPKFAKVARALRGDASKVAVVAVDATEEEQLAEEYGIEGYPTFYLIPAGGSPTLYNEARTTTAMVNTINDAFGTDRLANGRLTMMAGTIADLNVYVDEWVQGSLSLEELGRKLPEGSYYKRVVESIAAHGKQFIVKEKVRLEKMLSSAAASVKPEQLDSMQRRYNILNVFDDERKPVDDGM